MPIVIPARLLAAAAVVWLLVGISSPGGDGTFLTRRVPRHEPYPTGDTALAIRRR